jgi:uracil-DNA glycosylase
MAEASIKLEESWKEALSQEFASPYMQQLKSFLVEEKQRGKAIFPRGSEYFRALDLTPLDEVQVVILGQDPYHGAGQAHGLCFSVRPGVRIPPSLVNIYKELEADLGIPPARHGFLESWAKQGVLLLNSVLTVEESQAASHQGKGWERFTDAVIRQVNDECDGVVFMLWGSYAQKKAAFVDQTKHPCTHRRSPPTTASSAAGISPRLMPIWPSMAESRLTGLCRVIRTIADFILNDPLSSFNN